MVRTRKALGENNYSCILFIKKNALAAIVAYQAFCAAFSACFLLCKLTHAPSFLLQFQYFTFFCSYVDTVSSMGSQFLRSIIRFLADCTVLALSKLKK